MENRFANVTSCVVMVLLASIPPALQAQDEVPQTTPEGMELLTQTDTRIVYAMPGATLDQYTRVALVDCYVAFRKDWQRDYNRRASFGLRVSAEDMERIKTDLAREFKNVFTDVLVEAGHEVVDHTGEDVIVLRPALVNLDVAAPDVGTAFDNVIVRSAGQMTLYMELYDSTTNAIIARVTDAQAANRGIGFEANRVTNKAEADRILRRWAEELESHLGAAREVASDEGG